MNFPEITIKKTLNKMSSSLPQFQWLMPASAVKTPSAQTISSMSTSGPTNAAAIDQQSCQLLCLQQPKN
jgi:hypothetical protein